MAQEIKEADLSIRTLDGDSRWQLVERFVATPDSRDLPRLSSFLMYVCRQSLLGRSSELNEQIIGEVVFERAAGYDPRDDNIVRSHASRLKCALNLIFAMKEPLRRFA